MTAGLLGFYGSCTVFGVAVTLSALAWIAFPDFDGMRFLGWFGVIVALLSAIATWYFLGRLRRER